MLLPLNLADSYKFTVAMLGIAALLPYVCAIFAKTRGGFRAVNNQEPRTFLAQLTGAAARLNAAQLNSFEGLPLFFVSVLVALYFFVPSAIINQFAFMYVVSRALYILAYALNWSFLRSVLWFIGLLSCLALLYISYLMA